MLNVFDIQRGSYHDGPGIRTVVFLKGCNMACLWCQNPESQKMKKEILFYAERCIGCGCCREICPNGCFSAGEGGAILYDRTNCDACGRCVDVCCSSALQASGAMMTEEEVFCEVMKDKTLYGMTGGGLTLSGGEPLLQHEACVTLLKMTKQAGVSTAVETAGNVGKDVLRAVLPWLDYVLIDLKLLSGQKHQSYCGCSNKTVLETIRELAKSDIRLTVRTPVIPGVNDDEESIREIACFLKDAGVSSYELLPFHKMGGNKYKALGKTYETEDYPSLTKSDVVPLQEMADRIIKEEPERKDEDRIL